MPDISIVIVTWNSEGEIVNCVNSMPKAVGNASYELIIVDNDSKDNTLMQIGSLNYPNIKIIKNNANLGYTAAVNQGIGASKGKNIFLLNPDTVLHEYSLAILNNFLGNNPLYGACAPLLVNPDGTIQESVRSFPGYWDMFCEFSLLAYILPKTKLFGKWKMKYFNYRSDADVQQPMAAALMIRKSILDKVNNMDERFQMFFNDVDLCKKIIDSGSKIRLITSSKITHEKGVSIYKDRIRMIKIWNMDCSKFFEKHHNNFSMLLWLNINLKISEIIRILYYKLLTTKY